MTESTAQQLTAIPRMLWSIDAGLEDLEESLASILSSDCPEAATVARAVRRMRRRLRARVVRPLQPALTAAAEVILEAPPF